MRNISRRGFTLVEMLLVVFIIGMLSGMVFGLVHAALRRSEIAKTRRKLELLADGIEVFRSTYGTYPPVRYLGSEQPFYYEYPDSGQWGGLGGKYGPPTAVAKAVFNEGDSQLAFTFGLMSFLVPRFKGHADNKICVDVFIGTKGNNSNFKRVNDGSKPSAWYSYNTSYTDIQKDLDTSTRIAPFVNGILHWTHHKHTMSGQPYSNTVITVLDAWDHHICYESKPPHDRYRLWSIGPDGKNGTKDDIYAGKEMAHVDTETGK